MRDEEFIRGQVPMTKSEVRAVAISKLSLRPDSALVDVGAGTGSVSVEAARSLPAGTVTAIERNPEACGLIRKNMEKFGTENITVLCGMAAEVLRRKMGEMRFTHAFVGGTSGETGEILDLLTAGNPGIRVVMSAVSLETIACVTGWLERNGREAEIVELSVAKAGKVGSHHLMMAQNPVYLFTFGGEDD